MSKVNVNLEIGYELAERGLHYFVEGNWTAEIYKFRPCNELEEQILEDFNKKYLLYNKDNVMIVRLYDKADEEARGYMHFAFYERGVLVKEFYLQDIKKPSGEDRRRFSDLMVGGDYCLFYDDVDDSYVEFFDKKIKKLNREGEVVQDIEFSLFWDIRDRLDKLV